MMSACWLDAVSASFPPISSFPTRLPRHVNKEEVLTYLAAGGSAAAQ